MTSVAVARRYKFRGRHHVPGLPTPWCEPHNHDYTVEVVAQHEQGFCPVRRGRDCISPECATGCADDRKNRFIVVDTDLVDAAWQAIGPKPGEAPFDPRIGKLHHLNKQFAETTVEFLASMWLEGFRKIVPQVVEVTVWEDDSRWGRARI